MKALHLTPRSWRALGERDAAQLEQRARKLGVVVHASRSTPGAAWHTRAYRPGDMANIVILRGYGPLAPIIAGLLDDWTEKYGWTGEEILTVAAQSGLEVRRA